MGVLSAWGARIAQHRCRCRCLCCCRRSAPLPLLVCYCCRRCCPQPAAWLPLLTPIIPPSRYHRSPLSYHTCFPSISTMTRFRWGSLPAARDASAIAAPMARPPSRAAVYQMRQPPHPASVCQTPQFELVAPKIRACFGAAFLCTQLTCHVWESQLPLSRSARVQLRHIAAAAVMAFMIAVSRMMRHSEILQA